MADAKNESKSNTGPSENPNMSPAEAVDQLRNLFSTLVPPEQLEIEDALGNTYLTRSSIPARAQIKVMQQLDKIWATDMAGINTGDEMGVAGISRLVVSLCTNEVIFESICSAFGCAHPRVVDAAKRNAIEAGLPKKECSHPADLFPVEEIVAGLIPFFIRLAQRAVSIVQKVSNTAVNQEN